MQTTRFALLRCKGRPSLAGHLKRAFTIWNIEMPPRITFLCHCSEYSFNIRREIHKCVSLIRGTARCDILGSRCDFCWGRCDFFGVTRNTPLQYDLLELGNQLPTNRDGRWDFLNPTLRNPKCFISVREAPRWDIFWAWELCDI